MISLSSFIFGFAVALVGAYGHPQYRNTEFGMGVVFPAGVRVCTARSGDHPHGFYGWFGGSPTLCDATRIADNSSALSVYASYNSTFDNSPREEAARRCRERGAPIAINLDTISMANRPSSVCAIRLSNNSIEISIFSQSGEIITRTGSYPRVLYSATLTTNQSMVDRDIEEFSRFVSNIDIALQ